MFEDPGCYAYKLKQPKLAYGHDYVVCAKMAKLNFEFGLELGWQYH